MNLVTQSTRTAIVTGAAGGIGLACVEGLVLAGHRIAMVDSDGDRLSRAGREFPPGQVLLVCGDVADEALAGRVTDAIAARDWSPTAILVNNAGISPKHNGRSPDVLGVSLEEWRRVLDVNLTSAMLLSRAVIPAMREQRWGRIVNVVSSAARTSAMVAGASYMASKAGLLGLTRHIATVFARDGITANAVAPGRTISPMTAETAHLFAEPYKARNPTGREGSVDEIAAAVLYLASERAGYTNGACIDVNGGMFMS